MHFSNTTSVLMILGNPLNADKRNCIPEALGHLHFKLSVKCPLLKGFFFVHLNFVYSIWFIFTLYSNRKMHKTWKKF